MIFLILMLIKYGLILLFNLILVFAIKMYFSPEVNADLTRHDSEKSYFLDRSKRTKKNFPSITDVPSVKISVIIPAYNEEERLPVCLDEIFQYFENQNDYSSIF